MGRTHVSQVQLRLADVNFSGHMDNVSILRLVDEARTHFLGFRGTHDDAYTGGLLQVCGPGVGILVAQQTIEYVRELWYDAAVPAQVRMWLSHIGTSSIVVASEIRRREGAEAAVRSEASIALVTLGENRPWRLTGPVRAAFGEYLGPAVPLRPRAR